MTVPSVRGRFRVGARGSRLSRLQTEGALAFLAQRFPGTRYRVVSVETPGDRDLVTPIEKSAPDFFTRDLDAAVLAGAIDFAVHSAKDIPPELAPGLDWFWLPNHADPRDCWVIRKDARRIRKVGVSSERRRAAAAARFPKAQLLPVRGAVDARLKLVQDGTFDAVPMALAGLERLFPDGFSSSRVPSAATLAALRNLTFEPIPLEVLAPPEAQGVLAVVFRAGDVRLQTVRARFVKAVRFVSAGVGDAGLCTCAGRDDLASADVVLADDLLGTALLDGLSARVIRVGKRCGAHSMNQAAITRLICNEVRKGYRVVRLKGGDAGLFGRLAEETDALAELGIPFVVRPGVSALVAATTGTGMLLTRRGVSAGFTVYTPRRAAEGACTAAEERFLPQVAFMAAKLTAGEAQRLLAAGWPAETPCAVVWDAAGCRERVAHATLETAAQGALVDVDETAPGIFVAGSAATTQWPPLGAFAGARFLVTCSDAVMAKACLRIEDGGGRPIRWPLIQLVPKEVSAWGMEVSQVDAVVLTSPAAVRAFFQACTLDRRRLPKFFTCGAGTDAALRQYGVASDLMPSCDFSAAGLIAELARHDLKGMKVLRLRSALAGTDVARALRRAGAKVIDRVLYDNLPVVHEGPLPSFDAVFFASASAVRVFLDQYGASALHGKMLYVMGQPTRAALPVRMRKRARQLFAACLG